MDTGITVLRQMAKPLLLHASGNLNRSGNFADFKRKPATFHEAI